jgi:5'(3')-deoxyribonucleotidase
MYTQVFTRPFLEDVKAIKKDKNLIERLNGKINEILRNPEHYKPLGVYFGRIYEVQGEYRK